MSRSWYGLREHTWTRIRRLLGLGICGGTGNGSVGVYDEPAENYVVPSFVAVGETRSRAI